MIVGRNGVSHQILAVIEEPEKAGFAVIGHNLSGLVSGIPTVSFFLKGNKSEDLFTEFRDSNFAAASGFLKFLYSIDFCRQC